MGVHIPATGTGDTTPLVATDKIAGVDYQQIKVVDGTVGGTQGAVVDSLGNLRVALNAATALLGASVSNFPGTQPVSIASVAGGVGTLGASVTNFPAVQPVSGSVSIVNLLNPQPVSGSVAITGGYVGASVANFPATQSVQGLVGASVSNFPANQGVTIASTSVTQPVSGNVTASVIGYVGASITNPGALSAASQVLVGGSTTVYVASQPAQTLTGLVGASISNTPQISIASYAVTQPVSLASTNVTQPVSGNLTASVAGYVGASVAGPLTASVIGYVGASVTNFPATQSIQGLVGASIANTPTVTLASSTIQVGVSVANFPTNIGSVSSLNVGGSTIAIPAAAPVAGVGASPYHYISGASFNSVNVKNSAGTLYTLAAMNVNTSPRYLRLFDKSTTPSPGTDLPRQTYVIPGASAGAGAVIPLPVGLLFAAGIGFDITGGSMGDTDQTVTALGDVVVNLGYS